MFKKILRNIQYLIITLLLLTMVLEFCVVPMMFMIGHDIKFDADSYRMLASVCYAYGYDDIGDEEMQKAEAIDMKAEKVLGIANKLGFIYPNY